MIKVWYKFPNDTQIFHLKGKSLTSAPENGFVMMPFNGKQPLYLPLDSLKSSQLSSLHQLSSDPFSLPKAPVIENIDYQAMVKIALSSIEKNKFQKVVLARQKECYYSLSPLTIFEKLCEIYTNCFVHLIYEENKWCDIGASPELLLSANPDLVKSVSMAGTVTHKDSGFHQKEKEEQQFVTDYILDAFNDFSLVPKIKNDIIGNGVLSHLYTTIESPSSMTHRQNLKLIDQLHPTPAVCGFPKGTAQEFINDNEDFEREWYAGYLGIIGSLRTETYVNLRCARLYQDTAILYAGAGITKDSVPLDELNETEAKFQVVSRFLN